jgi:hypothetical protein
MQAVADDFLSDAAGRANSGAGGRNHTIGPALEFQFRLAVTRTYWEVGRRIVDQEQQGKKRAVYGEALIERLALDLTAKFGRGFSQSNLWQMRDFYLGWPILQTVSGESQQSKITSGHSQNLQTLSELSGETSLQRFPLPWSHYVPSLAKMMTDFEINSLRAGL